jgi:hypothetical protein
LRWIDPNRIQDFGTPIARLESRSDDIHSGRRVVEMGRRRWKKESAGNHTIEDLDWVREHAAII